MKKLANCLPLVSWCVVVTLAVGGTVEAQCSMCRTGIESSPEGQAMAAGFNQAILFLLAAPMLILTGVSLALWRGGRRGTVAEQPVRVEQ